MTEFQIVTTDDGSLTLLHSELAECYHSRGGARLEARSLYVEASGLEQALQIHDRLRILDVGLGLGYNVMETLELLLRGGHCHSETKPMLIEIVSLEQNLELFAQLRKGQGAWQAGWPSHWIQWCQSLVETKRFQSEQLQGAFHCTLEVGTVQVVWTVYLGDAKLIVSDLDKGFDFIWQDPFSPKSNPSLWDVTWFASLAALTGDQRNCVMMTYSVAAQVRQALGLAGWAVTRIPGLGSKRHWLRAEMSGRQSSTNEN